MPVKRVRADRDKRARASVAATLMAEGRVYFRAYPRAEWLEDLEDELASFPGGAHDDQVDALSYAAQELVLGEVEVPLASPEPATIEPHRKRASHSFGPFRGGVPVQGRSPLRTVNRALSSKNLSGAAVRAGWLLLAGSHLAHLGAPFLSSALRACASHCSVFLFDATVCCDDLFPWIVYKAAARLTRTLIGAISCIRTSQNPPARSFGNAPYPKLDEQAGSRVPPVGTPTRARPGDVTVGRDPRAGDAGPRPRRAPPAPPSVGVARNLASGRFVFWWVRNVSRCKGRLLP
jgi:hypothetical protein